MYLTLHNLSQTSPSSSYPIPPLSQSWPKIISVTKRVILQKQLQASRAGLGWFFAFLDPAWFRRDEAGRPSTRSRSLVCLVCPPSTVPTLQCLLYRDKPHIPAPRCSSNPSPPLYLSLPSTSTLSSGSTRTSSSPHTPRTSASALPHSLRRSTPRQRPARPAVLPPSRAPRHTTLKTRPPSTTICDDEHSRRF